MLATGHYNGLEYKKEWVVLRTAWSFISIEIISSKALLHYVNIWGKSVVDKTNNNFLYFADAIVGAVAMLIILISNIIVFVARKKLTHVCSNWV